MSSIDGRIKVVSDALAMRVYVQFRPSECDYENQGSLMRILITPRERSEARTFVDPGQGHFGRTTAYDVGCCAVKLAVTIAFSMGLLVFDPCCICTERVCQN